MTPYTRKRKAWLITWESPRLDYIEDLGRPRIVAILNSRHADKAIKTILLVLFYSESRMTFSQKLEASLSSSSSKSFWQEMGGICYGDNPWLWARTVSDLHVQKCQGCHDVETVFWKEPSYMKSSDENDGRERIDPRQRSESKDFRCL
jgi:hypothetical protein